MVEGNFGKDGNKDQNDAVTSKFHDQLQAGADHNKEPKTQEPLSGRSAEAMFKSALNTTTAAAAPKDESILDKAVKNSAVARYGLVTAEGAVMTVPGAYHAAVHDLTHPLEFGGKIATAAGIGIAMKTLLPRTGVGKAVVGGVMGLYMVKDAAMPLIHAYSDAGSAKDMNAIHKAAQTMGDGLGAFAWDAYIGGKVGMKAENITGRVMESTMGTHKYAAFERAKVDFFSSDSSIVGRTLNKFVKPIDAMTDQIHDRLTTKPETPEIPLEVAIKKAQEVREQNIATLGSANMHFKGMETADAKTLGFSQTIDLLEQGHDPRRLSADEATRILGTQRGVADNVQTGTSAPAGEVRVADQAITKSIVGPNDFQGKGPNDAPSGKSDGGAETGKDVTSPANSGDTARPGDAAKPDLKADVKDGADPIPAPAAATGKYTTKAEQEVNVGNITKMAAMNTKEMAQWPDVRVAITDAVENALAPIHAATTPGYKPMDAGYILPRNQAVAIGRQIQSVKDLRYIDPLMSRFTTATNQHISQGLTETANLKQELDLFAREIHSTLVRNLVKAGIDPNEVLRSKNPPVFAVMADGGAGPHTMRQIDGVWNLDHVLYPRNMVGTRSTTTSGIHGHEVGHDQYGGILKFEDSIRENVIKDAVRKGLGDRANEKVNVPGHGEMTKADLIENILKAQADENTADIWGAAWTGHNGGGALGILLQSLRKGGQLETRNVFGKEFVADDNPMGFEVHGFDAIRPKIVAATMRARANGDQRVLDYAKALDRYSDEASRPGDYVFANMDKPGETVTIARKDLEDVIPHLIDAQMNTPLPALKGKSFADILPDLPTNMAKMDTLADLMVDAVQKGKKPSDIPFDTQHYTITQVFGAGMPAALRLVGGGMDATEANAAVNTMSDYLRALYHENDPHVDPLKPSTLQTIRLSSFKDAVASSKKLASAFTEGTGRLIGFQPKMREITAENTAGVGGAAGVMFLENNLINPEKDKTALNFQPTADTKLASAADNWLSQRDRTMANITYMSGRGKQILDPSAEEMKKVE